MGSTAAGSGDLPHQPLLVAPDSTRAHGRGRRHGRRQLRLTVPHPPDEVWVHPDVAVEESAIEGRGLFARVPLPAGEVVIRLGGRLVSLAELHRLFDTVDTVAATGDYIDTIAVDNDLHLVVPPGTAAHFANHPCDPALWHVG